MRTDDIEIVDYQQCYAEAFRDLNLEWLEAYFCVEPVDEAVLGDPEGHILRRGGAILMALQRGQAVGTVALLRRGAGVELTKMAVRSGLRGAGIGRKLMSAALARAAQMDASPLFLFTNSRLKPAVALYESVGFEHRPPPADAVYERADVYMVYQGAPSRPSR